MPPVGSGGIHFFFRFLVRDFLLLRNALLVQIPLRFWSGLAPFVFTFHLIPPILPPTLSYMKKAEISLLRAIISEPYERCKTPHILNTLTDNTKQVLSPRSGQEPKLFDKRQQHRQ